MRKKVKLERTEQQRYQLLP